MNMDIDIRPWRRTTAPRSGRSACRRSPTPRRPPAPPQDEEAGRTDAEIAARIRPTGMQIVFGAFAGNALAGIAGLRREPLARCGTRPCCGACSSLPPIAREEGVLQIHLSVNAENDWVRRLYPSLGFETYGREPRSMRVGGRFFDEEHMVLRLDGA